MSYPTIWQPGLTSLGNSGLCWTVFARNRDTAVPAEGNGDLQTLICVLVARPGWCPTLSNPVPWQNWMVAYLGYTLRINTLFRCWPIMVNDMHTRRRQTAVAKYDVSSCSCSCSSVDVVFCWAGGNEGQVQSDSDPLSATARGRDGLHWAAEPVDQQKHSYAQTGQEHFCESWHCTRLQTRTRLSTTSGNLLEFEIHSGNTGNLMEFHCSSWTFSCNRSMIDDCQEGHCVIKFSCGPVIGNQLAQPVY